MKPGFASVIIVGYNNWPDLEMAIRSALRQSYEQLEVIVVDNDSTDATPTEVPKLFGEAVRYIRQANLWDSGAYNTGYRASEGEFIQFLDGDDVLAPDKIAKQVEVFRATPDADIVFGDIRQFQTLPELANWKDLETRDCADILSVLLLPDGNGAGLSALGTLFRRTAVERIGPWDESLYTSDSDYWLRAAWIGCRFRHCPGLPMGFSRKRPGQMSADASAMMYGIEAVWAKALQYIDREPYRETLSRNLGRLRYYLAISQDHMTADQSMAKLKEARLASAAAVPWSTYFVGKALIAVPGGRYLVTARWLRFVRRVAAALLGFEIPK